MLSRLLNGIMPFRAGRDHLHHKLLNIGFKPKKILLIMIFVSAALATVGFLIELNYDDKEFVSFYAFLSFALFYYLLSKKNVKQNV